MCYQCKNLQSLSHGINCRVYQLERGNCFWKSEFCCFCEIRHYLCRFCKQPETECTPHLCKELAIQKVNPDRYIKFKQAVDYLEKLYTDKLKEHNRNFDQRRSHFCQDPAKRNYLEPKSAADLALEFCEKYNNIEVCYLDFPAISLPSENSGLQYYLHPDLSTCCSYALRKSAILLRLGHIQFVSKKSKGFSSPYNLFPHLRDTVYCGKCMFTDEDSGAD